MIKPKAHGHKGMKPAKPPMGAGGPASSGAGPAQAGRAGGAIAIKPAASLKQFGHAAPGLKELQTDRGDFKIK